VLFDRVLAQGGALVARVPDPTPPTPPRFLQRNWILAALTEATLVIQAGLISGARSTAAAARRLGRTLCVVPQAPWDERGLGCALELARGAHPVCGVADLLAALGRPAPLPRRTRSKSRGAQAGALPLSPVAEPPAIGPTEAALLAALGDEPVHIDEACERAGLSAWVAAGALLTLTLRAVVVEGPAGFFRRLPPASSVPPAQPSSVRAAPNR
jgi:DNA processing protein